MVSNGVLPQNFSIICDHQVLVTHHVELVLSGAYYLVRMLDGRIDIQGTIENLQAQGALDGIGRSAMLDAHKEELSLIESRDMDAALEDHPSESEFEHKKPRKLIKDEHRETGGVKWSVYESYLKASCVFF